LSHVGGTEIPSEQEPTEIDTECENSVRSGGEMNSETDSEIMSRSEKREEFQQVQGEKLVI
jgi:hypothetical protein